MCHSSYSINQLAHKNIFQLSGNHFQFLFHPIKNLPTYWLTSCHHNMQQQTASYFWTELNRSRDNIIQMPQDGCNSFIVIRYCDGFLIDKKFSFVCTIIMVKCFLLANPTWSTRQCVYNQGQKDIKLHIHWVRFVETKKWTIWLSRIK